MLERSVNHFIHNVLPAATEYLTAEHILSERYNADPNDWERVAIQAKRKAAELAVAIDGLSDRATIELARPLHQIREEVSALCYYFNDTEPREGCFKRVRGVANAYKHADLRDTNLPISSDEDVLVVGLSYGADGFNIGKFSGVEVMVRENNGSQWKFLGDAPVSLAAWQRFLVVNGAILPNELNFDVFDMGLCA